MVQRIIENLTLALANKRMPGLAYAMRGTRIAICALKVGSKRRNLNFRPIGGKGKMIHQLKIESDYFRKIVESVKTFEVRRNDRDFHVGDYLGLNEITDHPCNESGERKETGNFVLVRVLDVLKDNRFVKEGYVIMSIRPCTIKEVDWDYAPWYSESNAALPTIPKEKVE